MAIFLHFDACISIRAVHQRLPFNSQDKGRAATKTRIRIPLINSAPGKNCLAGK
jgi:hypothetical protein